MNNWKVIPVLMACLIGCGDEEAAESATDTKLPAPQFDSWPGSTSSTGVAEEDTDPNSEEQCCQSDEECEPGWLCLGEEGEGECAVAPNPTEGTCYTDSDCPDEATCQNATVCGCDACDLVTELGTCSGTTPPPATDCCETTEDCLAQSICIAGMCHSSPGAGECWADTDCPPESVCEGATFCLCGEDCTAGEIGQCTDISPPAQQCGSDADCPDGSCMAGDTCADGCPAGDPSCCTDSVCIPVQNECVQDSECGIGGKCQAGAICYDHCTEKEPACCFGNTCQTNPCLAINPQGCYVTGCPDGASCQPTQECIPTSCTCDPTTGWTCTDDCVGGACQVSSCPGKNPQGCATTGCPEGLVCVTNAGCAPSTCECDETDSSWSCSLDCNGGKCIAP